jgi:hypothetical protein
MIDLEITPAPLKLEVTCKKSKMVKITNINQITDIMHKRGHIIKLLESKKIRDKQDIVDAVVDFPIEVEFLEEKPESELSPEKLYFFVKVNAKSTTFYIFQ